MKSFLFRPCIFYTLCLGHSSLSPTWLAYLHLLVLSSNITSSGRDLPDHHSPGPPPAFNPSTDHTYLITCIFFIGSFLLWKFYFLWYGLPFEQMVQRNGHEAKNLLFSPLDHLDQWPTEELPFFLNAEWGRQRRRHPSQVAEQNQKEETWISLVECGRD